MNSEATAELPPGMLGDARRADHTKIPRGRLLDPESLRAFIAVVECGGYTRAGRHLHRTQAAISQQVARLEGCVGFEVFQRPKRLLRLTTRGTLLLEYAYRLLALNEEAMSILRPGLVSGSVRVGATNFYATTVLPPLLAEFSERYPSVHIDLEVGVAQHMQRRLGSGLDLTINAFETGEGNGVLLRRDPVVWAASLESATFLKEPLPLAVLPTGSLLRRWAEQALSAAGRRWVVIQDTASVEVLKASVLAGLAVGVFHAATVEATPSIRILTTRDGFPELPCAEMWLDRAGHDLSPAAKCLHEFLLERLPRCA